MAGERPEGSLLGAEDPQIRLSVIIVNRNTRDLLRACLRSIERGADPSIETIVVDNASRDGSLEMVQSDFPRVRLIGNEVNRGFSEANNQGLRIATGRHIMLLNSDTEVGAGALSSLIATIEADRSIGVVGPALRFPDGQRQRSAFSFETPWRHFCDMLALGRLFPGSSIFANQHSRLDYSSAGEVDWLIGAALVVRREAIERVGLLDETLRIHCNDSDWCFRIRRAGYSVRYEPTAEVVHHSGATIRSERNPELEQEMLRNLFAYYRKHYGAPGVVWMRAWSVIGYGLRSLLGFVRGRERTGDRGERWTGPSFARLAWMALVGAGGAAVVSEARPDQSSVRSGRSG